MSARAAILLPDESCPAPDTDAPADNTCGLAVPGGGTLDDQIEFSMLPMKAQRDVTEWCADLASCRKLPHGKRGDRMNRIAARRGCSWKLVRLKYDRWREAGWRALVNRSKFKGQTLKQAFVQFWLGLVEGHTRRTTVKQSWRMLLERLKAWERDGGFADSEYTIPGYDRAPRRNKSTGLPPGWHLSTLSRIAAREAERKARAEGPKAWSATLPSVRASREGCEVGQFLFFDDETLDVLVNFPGNNTGMRPNAFHCLDFVSACNIGRGFKPVIHEGNSRRTVCSNLTKRDFDWFLLYVLTVHGWNPHTGTVLCGEMGTACASDWMQDAIARVFPDKKVQWDHSGRFGEPMRGMIYEGQSCGNFRFKAPLESWFNLWRNWMAALPGSTGRCVEEAPEELYGLQRENAWYLKQLERLPEHRRQLLISPVMEWGQFVTTGNQLVEIINQRTDHTLGQWEKMEFVRPVIYDALAAADPAARERLLASPEAMRALAYADPRIRRMSPREVWDAHSPKLRRLDPWMLPQLMPLEDAHPVKVSADRCIYIKNREIDSEVLEYQATHCRTAHGDDLTLRPGDEMLAYLNPYAAGELVLVRMNGSYLGTVARRLRNSRSDRDGLMEQYGKLKAAVAPVLADIAARGSSESNRRMEERAENRRIADLTKPLTPAELAAAEAGREMRQAFAAPDHDDDGGEEDSAAAAGTGNGNGGMDFRAAFAAGA